MYLAFALDHIPRRMRELGFGDNYLTRYQQVLAVDNVNLVIEAKKQIWIFIEPEGSLKIESERGVYDITDTTINVQQHEHSGKITVLNESGRDVYVLFIQVIPLNKKTTTK